METSLKHDTAATAIPSGEPLTLPAGSSVYITQTLGGNVTVRTDRGLFRIAAENAGALAGYAPAAPTGDTGANGDFSEAAVWAALKTCFDPEIPVNIVDLGLVYDLAVERTADGTHLVEAKMTLTAPGCGMGPVIAEDARQKIAALPTVSAAKVHIVWDPVWTPQMISPAGRKTLGLE
jgi:probable FeS assembly SUF system protein SufT